MPNSYDNDAILGAKIERLVASILQKHIDGGLVTADAVNELKARLESVEKFVTESNIGERVADSLDAQTLKVGGTDVDDATGHTVTFSQASSRGTASDDFASGSNLSVLFGKVRKWFADLGSLAFKSSAGKSDLSSSVQGSLDKADSAVQSVKINGGTELKNGSNVNIPMASANGAGAVQLATSIGATVASENGKAASEKAVRDAIDSAVSSVSAVGPYTAFTLNDGIKGYTHLFTLDFGTVKKGVCEFRVNCTRAITDTVVINASIARTDDTGGTTKAWMTLTAETVAITDYFKICYKESSDSTSSRPKYDIWLIDTGSNIASARRIGVEIVNTNIASISKGGTTTETLPSDLVDFTYANVKEVAVSSRNLYNQGNSSNTKFPVFFDGSGSGFKGVYTMPNLTAYYDTGNGVIWIVGASNGEKTNARRGSVRIGNGAYVGKIWSDNLTESRDLQLPNASGTFALQNGDYRTQGLQSAYATQSGFANESTYAEKIGSAASHPQIGGPKIPVYVDQYGNVIECDSPSTWIIGFASRASKLYASSYGASNIPFFLKDDGESWGDANQAFRIPHTVARWHMEMNNGTVTGVGVQHFTSRFLGGPSDNLILSLITPSTNVLQLTVDARTTSSWYGGQVWGTIKWDSQTGSNINSNIERIGDSNLNGEVVLASRNISVNNVQDIQGHALFAICTGDFLHKFVVDMEISVIKPNASSTLCYVSVMSKCFEEDFLH